MKYECEKSYYVVVSNLFALIFPWVSGGFLCTIPDFLNHIRKGNLNWNFFMIYAIYLLMFALFLYVLLCRGKCIFVACDVVGIISIAIFHVEKVWAVIPNGIYIAIWGAFPYNFFLIEILGVVYLLNVFSFHLRKNREIDKSKQQT